VTSLQSHPIDACRPALRLWLKSLDFKGVLLPNFNRIVERELLIVAVQRLEGSFNIARTNLSISLDISDFGCKRRKCEQT
jgi:hypothetical protein